MSQWRKLNYALCPPHLFQFIPVQGKPFLDQSLRCQRKITIGHFKRRQLKNTNAISVNGMNMRRVMFFRLKEHLHYDTVESRNFWHFVLLPFVPSKRGLGYILLHPPHAGNLALRYGLQTLEFRSDRFSNVCIPRGTRRIIAKPPRSNQARLQKGCTETFMHEGAVCQHHRDSTYTVPYVPTN